MIAKYASVIRGEWVLRVTSELYSASFTDLWSVYFDWQHPYAMHCKFVETNHVSHTPEEHHIHVH